MGFLVVCGTLIVTALLRASRGIQPIGNTAVAVLVAMCLLSTVQGFEVIGFVLLSTALLFDYLMTLVARKWDYEKTGTPFRACREVASGMCYLLLMMPMGAALMFGSVSVSMMGIAAAVVLGCFVDRYRKLWRLPPRP
ncbi:hypothetical protein [Paraburkholderia humisilvae]|nr:hypothetical protein [Paraburkholderia humisilvae]